MSGSSGVSRFAFVLLLSSITAPALAQAPTVPPAKAIALDPVMADKESGYYQLGPRQVVRYWREGEHFYFGLVGTSQRAEIYALAPNRFVMANGLVRFTFNAGTDGTIASLTVNQAGRDIAATRIDEATARALAAPLPVVARTWPMMTGVVIHDLTKTEGGSMDYWPCFSPDGKTILFSRTLDGGKHWTLMTVPASGGAAKSFIAQPISATRASWSPVTNRIAFDGDANGKTSLWIVNGDGSGAHVVTTGGLLDASYPSFYPDGKTLGFGDGPRNILYRMNEGSAPVAITRQEQVLSGMSSVSPDGKWVAFAGQPNKGQVYNQNDNQIWLADGKGAARPLEADPGQGRSPSWSPDGTRLAFESDRGSAGHQYAAFIIKRDGSGLVQVTDYALNANHPVFSPDGKRLVFAVGDPTRNISTIAVADLP
jgi:hypothetical protein